MYQKEHQPLPNLFGSSRVSGLPTTSLRVQFKPTSLRVQFNPTSLLANNLPKPLPLKSTAAIFALGAVRRESAVLKDSLLDFLAAGN
jgi:hypothetical protein